MRIRPLDPSKPGELNAAVVFSLMGVWEDAPEARLDPTAAPAMNQKERRALYASTLGSADFVIWLAEGDDGVLNGCAVCRMATDSRNVRYGHTVALYVVPGQRRDRVGAALVEAAEQFYADRGGGYVWAEAHHTNLTALHFYNALGYSLSEPRYNRWWFYVCLKRLSGTLPPPITTP